MTKIKKISTRTRTLWNKLTGMSQEIWESFYETDIEDIVKSLDNQAEFKDIVDLSLERIDDDYRDSIVEANLNFKKIVELLKGREKLLVVVKSFKESINNDLGYRLFK